MAHKDQMKGEVKLNFVLVGKTGHGKSATGNSILQRKVFKVSASPTSVTQEVNYSIAHFDHYILLVVDVPGLADTGNLDNMNTFQCLNAEKQDSEINTAAKHMDKALEMCYGGVDAFLLVLSFGNRFTPEDQTTLDILKQIFGDSYLDNVIVVVTGGDKFLGETKDVNVNFDKWCRQQTGAFRQLYDDCKGRFVLFNNREKNEEKKKRAQIQEVVQLALRLRVEYGQYTIQCLKQTERNLQKLLPQLKKTHLAEIIPEQSIPGMADTKQIMNIKLNLILIGKTGVGKSATGNMILNRCCFKSSAAGITVTKNVDFNFSQFGHRILMVVDGPPVHDTDLNSLCDVEQFVNYIDRACVMCYDGFDAFLFVIKFGDRLTSEDMDILACLRHLLGVTYIKHVIVVVTCGDIFQAAMEEEERDISFHEWCRTRTGELRQLYEDCQGRFVLFNNREKNKRKKQAQVQELVLLAQGLRDQHGRYTSQCFLDAQRGREKLLLEMKAPQLDVEIKNKVRLLLGDIEHLAAHPSDSERERIRACLQDLKSEVELQDNGFHVLDDLRVLLIKVQEQFEYVVRLNTLAKQLVDARRAPSVMKVLGSMFGLR